MESQQSPDRNLAMELMRATEAAALAGGRWMGRGDKNAADGASVDAMRLVLNSISMDGLVVIGEGERTKPDAVQRRADRRLCPLMDTCGRPARGHDAHVARSGNAISVMRWPSEARCSTGPCVYMEDRGRARRRRRHRPQRAGEGQPRSGRQGAGRARSDVTAVILDRTVTRASSASVARPGRTS